MTKNNYTLYENATISKMRGGISWKVELEDEECSILVKVETVDKIFTGTNTEETIIALILAYIECKRKALCFTSAKYPEKIDDIVIASAVGNLILSDYPIERIVEWVRNAKWHEIKAVLTSENPAEYLGEII